MANPFRKDQPSVRPPGLGPKEWGKLGVLFVVFCLMVGAMFGLHAMSRKKEPPAPPKKEEPKGATEEPKVEGPPPAQNLEEKAAQTVQTLRDGTEKIRKDQSEFLDFLYLMRKIDSKEVSKRVQAGLGASSAACPETS